MKRRRMMLLGLGAMGLVAAVLVGVLFFAPKGSTQVDQELAAQDATRVAQGPLEDGEPGHDVSGTVTLYRSAEGYWLRFEGYEATPGPDVYFYLTPTPRADSAAAVEREGLRVLVPGGAAGGQATLRGNFNVPLPADFDPDAYRGLSVWCDRFNVLFGYAVLS